MKDQYDIVVVGAGPAGSITAKTAAEHGLDVLLIEKRQEIGDPVRCAEGVSKKSLQRHIKPNGRWISAEVKGSRIYAPDRTKIEMSDDLSGDEVGYVLERKIFDRALAYSAAKAGAEVLVKTRATGLIIEDNFVQGIKGMSFGESFKVKSKIVIGADGIESKVGRWAGIDTTLSLKEIDTCAQFLMTNIDVDTDYCEFYLGNNIAPGGYVWIFPKGKNSANVGVGILGSKTNNQITALNKLKEFVNKNLLEGKIIEIVVGGVPVCGQIDRTIANGLMLVGDAARQSDPFTGGGIINAMDAGEIAGKVAAKAIANNDVSIKTLKEYENLWRNTIGKKLDKSLVVKEKFIKLTDEELNTLAHSVESVNLNKFTLSGLLFELFKKNPKILWDLKKLFV
ncbi:MAG TPA: NAD(P)/FAD-dependent oxidoreductase [Methanosarcinales archaeon]|nr:NAD(P)/FAD-dependent oxidoreductase [Methanosarcinales archaeon]